MVLGTSGYRLQVTSSAIRKHAFNQSGDKGCALQWELMDRESMLLAGAQWNGKESQTERWLWNTVMWFTGDCTAGLLLMMLCYRVFTLVLSSHTSHSMPNHHRKVQFSTRSLILTTFSQLLDSIENIILAKLQHPMSCSLCSARVQKSGKCMFWHAISTKHYHNFFSIQARVHMGLV